MKTKIYFFFLLLPATFLIMAQHLFAQHKKIKKTGINEHAFGMYTEQSQNNLQSNNRVQTVCSDTVYSVPQSALYFCFGGICGNDYPSMEISGSYGAAATADSAINWLCTWDHDGPGPKSSFPDSLVPGHNVHNSTNRAPFFSPNIIPSYLSIMPQVSPFALKYFIAATWQDSGKSMCFTPIAWDSIDATYHVYELDNCFGVGNPIQKIYVRAIHAAHFYSCAGGVNKLHIITRGGLPGFNHYQGYGDGSMYTVNINGTNYMSHWGDTVTVNATSQNIISISDSLSTPGIADGCTVFRDTLRPYPALSVTGLAATYNDNSPNATVAVLPKPSGAMRIDFYTSEPAAAGLYLLDALSDTVYSLYPLGDDFGPGNLVNVHTSLFIYDLAPDKAPYSIVASGDDGVGWQYASCFGLAHNGYFQVFDLSTGDSLSSKLFPVGDNQCGALATIFTDTFPGFYLTQFNKTQLTTSGNPASLSVVDSLGNATFSPSTAGAGTDSITFTYNDNRYGLCDMDTTIIVHINLFVGLDEPGMNSISVNNPFSDRLLIRDKLAEISEVELTDAQGRGLWRKVFTAGQSLDASGLSQGVYLFKAYDKQGRLVGKKKLVKIKTH